MCNQKGISKFELDISLSKFRNDLKNDNHNYWNNRVETPSSLDLKLLKIIKKCMNKKKINKKKYLKLGFLNKSLIIPFDEINKRFDYPKYINDYMVNGGFIISVQGEGLYLTPKGYDAIVSDRKEKITFITINTFAIIGVLCTIFVTVLQIIDKLC